MSLKNKFAMAPNLEQQGVMFEVDTARITVARAGGSNVRYTAAMEKVYREHGRAIQNDFMSNDKATAVVRKVYVDTIILNWETLVTPAEPGIGGKPAEYRQGIEDVRPDAPADAPLLPFNAENVDATLMALPDLLVEIRSIADNISLYRKSVLDSVAKN